MEDIAKVYDRVPLKTKYQVSSRAKQEFKNQQKLFRDMAKVHKGMLDLQIFGIYSDRRIEAIVKYMDEIRERFAGKYPDTLIELDYIRAETASINDYEMLESHYMISTAAAIWLLDELRIQGKLDEAYKLLSDDEAIERVHFADVYDAVHPQITIRSLVSAIQKRNDAIQNRENYCYIVDVGTARKRKVSSSFREIVALLEPETIEQAVAEYKEAVWRWLDMFFAFNVSYSRNLDQAVRHLSDLQKPVKPNLEALKDFQFNQSKYSTVFNSLLLSSQSLDIRKEEAADRLENADKKQHTMFMFVQHCDERADQLGIKAVQAFSGYQAMNPFAAAFALIWLLDSGSDFPFLYFAGVGALEESCQKLPWLHDSNKKWQGNEIEKYFNIYETGIADDWYEKAQKIFDATGCLIPRNKGLYAWADKRVGKKLSPTAAVMLDVRQIDRLRLSFDMAQLEKEADEDDGESVDETDEPMNPDESEDELRNDNKKLKQELESLKLQLYEARRETQTERRKRETEAASHESERQELIDLRNYVFSLEQDEEPVVQESENRISLPYTVRKKIIVFGGHESWLKAIRAMLEGVRWVDKSERVNPEIIRNADIVFIQSNAMPHKMFYPIDDACKKYKIPMRYCCSASAERCAIQIAEADLAE